MKKIYELKHARAGLIAAATAALDSKDKAAYDAKMAEIKALNEEISALQAIEDEENRFGVSEKDILANKAKEDILMSKSQSIRSEKEYARAFAYAIANGITPKNAVGIEQVKPLLAALTIGGGSPAGEDGGFLVPVDIQTMINEQQRQLISLANYFNSENVTAATGWRPMDTAPTTGFTQLSGEVHSDGVPQDDQPLFSKISYSLDTYGLIVPVSKELAADETAGLFAYLARWFGKKQAITENTLLNTLLATLSPTTLTSGSEVTGLKTVLNKSLDPNIAAGASIITNQSGFAVLDGLEDAVGRPILQPDPTASTGMSFKGKPVIMLSDAMLANRTSGSDTLAPVYVGDFKQFGTLFRRNPLEMASTDVGGNAWSRYAIEVRGITRLDAVGFDSAAVVKREIKVV
jgi:HK97 family phage major capsid protein